jgi:hypothetical protein
VHQPTTPLDFAFGTPQHGGGHCPPRSVDQIRIQRSRKPLPKALARCRASRGAGRFVNVDGKNAHRGLSCVSFVAPNVRRFAYEFETERRAAA